MGGGTGGQVPTDCGGSSQRNGRSHRGVITRPFNFEGRRRTSQGDQGIDALQSRVDTLIVIPNNKLLAVISEQTPVQEAFGLPMTFCVKGARHLISLRSQV